MNDADPDPDPGAARRARVWREWVRRKPMGPLEFTLAFDCSDGHARRTLAHAERQAGGNLNVFEKLPGDADDFGVRLLVEPQPDGRIKHVHFNCPSCGKARGMTGQDLETLFETFKRLGASRYDVKQIPATMD